MKKQLSLLMALMISAGAASFSHADDNFDPPNIPLPTTTTTPATLEEQVERNAENISVNTDDVITNIYSIYENTVKIDDLDNRVTSLENSGGNTNPPPINYSSFVMPFSTSGQPRNFVVLRRDNDNGTTTYSIRLRYENGANETLTINGTDRAFSYFAAYGSVTVDQGGNIISVSKGIDGTDDTSYTIYAHSSTTYDPTTLTPIVDPNPRTFETIDNFTGEGALRNVIQTTTTHDETGSTTRTAIVSRIYTIGTGYEANGINFGQTPFRVEHRSRGSSRIRIQGIGTVETFGSGTFSTTPNRVVYYSVNGQTGGSLAGTPYQIGSPIYNLFVLN